jgi:hypothetical protein
VPASLHARQLRLTLGRTPILDQTELQLAPGWRVGLIGPNGVGKSTLLRVLARLQPVDDGTVTAMPSDATVGYLPQEPERSAHETVAQFLGRRTGVTDATAELDAATAALAAGDAGSDDRYAHALDRWLALGGADLDARIGPVWAELGLPERVLDQVMSTLSGGEAARVGSGRIVARTLRRVPARRAHQRPRPRRPRPARALGGAAERTDRDREPRPRVPAPHRHPRRRARRVHAPDHRVRRRVGRVRARARDRPRARPERYEEYADKKQSLLAACAARARVGEQGLSRAKKKPDDNDKNIKAFKINQTEQLAGKAARTEKADRTARGGRRAARGVAAAAHVRRDGTQRRRRRAAHRRDRRRRTTSGSDRST